MIFMSGLLFTPQTNEQVGNYILSAAVSSDGLSVVCTMNESSDYNYPGSEFTIHTGYIDIVPIEAVQSGATLTLSCDKHIRTGTNVTIDKLTMSNNFDRVSGQAVTNNSTEDAPEVSSIEVIESGDVVHVSVYEAIETHQWNKADFTVKVNGVEIDFVSDPYGEGSVIVLDLDDTILSGDTVLVSFSIVNDPQLKNFTDTVATNNSTVQGTEAIPPTYLLEEDLVYINGYYCLYNSATGATVHGKLCKPDGSAMSEAETTERYNKSNKTIDLSGGYYIDTGWIPPSGSTWNIIEANYINFGTVYSMDVFDYDGVSAMDIYRGSQSADFPLTPNSSDVPFSKSDTWKIYEERPTIGEIDEIVYTMGSFDTTLSQVYVSFGLNMTTLPPDVLHINSFTDGAATSATALKDKDGNDTGLFLEWDTDFHELTADYVITGDNSGFLYDAQEIRGFYYNCHEEASAPHTFTITGLDASSTYTFKISGSSMDDGRETKYTMNGVSTDVNMRYNTSDGATASGITGVTSFDIIVDRTTSDALMFVMGLNIIQTA